MILNIDGREIKTVNDFHDKLMVCPGMPDFYGRNLDAFYDVLTGFIEGPLKIVWHHAAVSRSNLGEEFDGLALAMKDAADYTRTWPDKFEFELIDN